MFFIGVLLLYLGYAEVYYGAKNIIAGSTVITFREAIGFAPKTVAPNGSGSTNTGPTPRSTQTFQDWLGQ